MAKKSQVKDTPKKETVAIHFPVDQCFPGYVMHSISLKLTPRQAAAAKVLWSSLSSIGERYDGGPSQNPNGTTVENASGAIRWMLDSLAQSIEKESGKDLTTDYDLTFGW